jgi:carbamoyltransferase
MNILGLYPAPFDNQLRHDYSASILTPKGIYAYEEAKLTTLKNENTSIFSERSLLMGLKELNLVPSEIDIIALPIRYTPGDMRVEKALYWDLFKFQRDDDKDFDVWKEKTMVYVPHHAAHVSIATFTSGLSECAFLSMDGGGDWGDNRNLVFGEYKNGAQQILKAESGMESIASFHAFLTEAIGFTGGDNGKTSGLAGYGKINADLAAKLESLIEVTENGLKFNRIRFHRSPVQLAKLNPSSYDRGKFLNTSPSDTNLLREVLGYLPQDIAATGEYVLQKFILSLLIQLKRITSQRKLVLTGGLFQNVALNSAILESGIFDDVFVPMAPSDAGLSFGLALFAEESLDRAGKQNSLKTREECNPYIGPSFTRSEIQSELENQQLIYSEVVDVEKIAAKLLSEGSVVGWFQGRAEYGPRSLGNRSILADPRMFDSKSRVNQLLKKRDWFMPYAPSMLEEHSTEWLEIDKFSPYMQFALNIKPEKRELIPAAVHVDGTSRVHSVRRAWNPRYWNLIEEFRVLTGVPLILNTSFNRHGISTIATPKQAIEHLLSGSMDYLIIDDFIVSLTENRSLSGKSFDDLLSEDQLLKELVLDRLNLLSKIGTSVQRDFYLDSMRQNGFHD